MAGKKERGQFYTTRAPLIFAGLPLPPAGARIIEPFAGQGDLLAWLAERGRPAAEAYDLEPRCRCAQRDTLLDPPDYAGAWVVTNPPYLARNKAKDKAAFDRYQTNDLFKCFLASLGDQCAGGIVVIPATFFFSPRSADAAGRARFLSRYRLSRVNYFEMPVFDDTPTTVAAFAFARSADPLTEQEVDWWRFPQGESRTFRMAASARWIVGGEIYAAAPAAPGVSLRRHVEGVPLAPEEQQTFLTLHALDSGRADGRIRLEFRPGYVYPGKNTSRSYATLRVSGAALSPEQQAALANRFNAELNRLRGEFWSLFLPAYRESKEYARKRIPFELAQRLVLHWWPT